jgi:hypothetical protein
VSQGNIIFLEGLWMQSISGQAGGTDISVKMTQAGAGTTHIEVIAQESTLRWNKDYAKEILAKIVQQS